LQRKKHNKKAKHTKPAKDDDLKESPYYKVPAPQYSPEPEVRNSNGHLGRGGGVVAR
jgi:hypothetical protein